MVNDDVQDDEFDSSPRPAKKRRVTGGAATKTKAESVAPKSTKSKRAPAKKKDKVDAEEPLINDRVADEKSRPLKTVLKSRRKAQTKTDITHNEDDEDDDEDEDAFEPPVLVKKTAPKARKKAIAKEVDEYDYDEGDNFAKPTKSKHRIHMPSAQTHLPEVFLGNELPPSSNPWDIRGPIWKVDVPSAPNPAPKSAGPDRTTTESRVGLGTSVLGPRKRTLPQLNTHGSRPYVPNTHRPAVAKSVQNVDLSEVFGSDVDEDAFEASLAVDLIALKSVAQVSGVEDKQSTRVGAPVKKPDSRTQPPPILALAGKTPFEESEIFGSEDDADAIEQLQAKEALVASERAAARTEPTSKGLASGSCHTAPRPGSRTKTEDELADLPSNAFDVDDELADLPSDAFQSSPSSLRETEDVIITSCTTNPHQPKKPNMAAPLVGLRQMTLFGGAVDPIGPATQAKKKHAFPLATQKETPTHHQLNHAAMETWIYPTNLGTIRDYQYNIVSRGLFHNLLVALPTGLGKTFIAATIMLNWFRWTQTAQIVFVAPTKPLVAQQIDACFHIAGIPRSQTVMLTGTTPPGLRAEEWKEKRVFFMTPQTIVNDLKTGMCDPKRIVLLVVDEAHRATGNYAYVEVVKFLRRFNQSFRVLALTATPGSTVEAVQQVIDGLDISRTEIRTEKSLDIRQYVHARDIDTMKFDYSDEQQMIMDLLSKAIQPVLTKLNGQNAYWLKDPMKLTAFGCTQAQRQWHASDTGKKASYPIKSMVQSIFTILASLAHGISLLKFHGIGPFFRSIVEFRNKVDGGEAKGKYALQIRQDENFGKMMTRVQSWVNNPDFLGHPKLEYLRGVVLNHFLDAGEGRAGPGGPPSATRIMIFAHWRDSAEEIVRVLKRNEPMIRPHVFVGQADSKHSEGMGQKRQLEVIQEFKDGKYNTLVATSIGEEGLDIGEVDLIVCYDASSSPIRMLQRMGRTGRKRKGNIVLLVMRDKEDKDFEQAKDNYEKMQAMISEGTRFTFHDDKSPRIIPREIQPAVDKRTVEIPIENSQADLPEPSRKRRVPKRPPKKFHMPDNVRTGFVKASRMDASDEELSGEETAQPRRNSKAKPKANHRAAPKRKASPKPRGEPEAVPLPFLEDYVHDTEDGAPTVTAPRLDTFPKIFPGPTRYVKHGQGTRRIANMMDRIHSINEGSIQRLKDNLHVTDLSGNVDNLLGEGESVTRHDVGEDFAELPTKVTARTMPMAKSRGRGRARRDSSDMEAASSSPEPTPANMRIATQGIDLGSDDTMGADESEDDPESELQDFVVGSDAPIELVSSSLPPTQDSSRRSRSDRVNMREESDEELPGLTSLSDYDDAVGKGNNQPIRRGRKRVVDDDSDD
ncbi:hypothetical protein MBLNU459_g4352t2 [Dothideomycetes sp. NU459]